MPCRKVTAANKYKAIAQNQIGSLHFLEKITKNTRKSKETAIHQNQLSNSRIKDPDEDSYFVDDELYKERFVVERTNAWLDGFT